MFTGLVHATGNLKLIIMLGQPLQESDLQGQVYILTGQRGFSLANPTRAATYYTGNIYLTTPNPNARITKLDLIFMVDNKEFLANERLFVNYNGKQVLANNYLVNHSNTDHLLFYTTLNSHLIYSKKCFLGVAWTDEFGYPHYDAFRLVLVDPDLEEEIEPLSASEQLMFYNYNQRSIAYVERYRQAGINLNQEQNPDNYLFLPLNATANVNNNNNNNNNEANTYFANNISGNVQLNGIRPIATGASNSLFLAARENNLRLSPGLYWEATLSQTDDGVAIQRTLPIPPRLQNRFIGDYELHSLDITMKGYNSEAKGSIIMIKYWVKHRRYVRLIFVSKLGEQLPQMIGQFKLNQDVNIIEDTRNKVQYATYSLPKISSDPIAFFVFVDVDNAWNRTVALTQTGKLFCGGQGTIKNLPCGAALGPNVSTMTEISGVAGEHGKIIDILTTNYGVFLLYEDSTVWAMGNNGDNGEDHLGLSTPGAFGTFTQLNLPTLALGERIVGFIHNEEANIGDTVSVIVEGQTLQGGRYSRIIAWGQNITGAIGTIPRDVTPLGENVLAYMNTNGETVYKVQDVHETGVFDIMAFGKFVSNAVIFWFMWNQPQTLLKVNA
jgi:hypothetical protein